jgi:hypothetical protein
MVPGMRSASALATPLVASRSACGLVTGCEHPSKALSGPPPAFYPFVPRAHTANRVRATLRLRAFLDSHGESLRQRWVRFSSSATLRLLRRSARPTCSSGRGSRRSCTRRRACSGGARRCDDAGGDHPCDDGRDRVYRGDGGACGACRGGDGASEPDRVDGDGCASDACGCAPGACHAGACDACRPSASCAAGSTSKEPSRSSGALRAEHASYDDEPL